MAKMYNVDFTIEKETYVNQSNDFKELAADGYASVDIKAMGETNEYLLIDNQEVSEEFLRDICEKFQGEIMIHVDNKRIVYCELDEAFKKDIDKIEIKIN